MSRKPQAAQLSFKVARLGLDPALSRAAATLSCSKVSLLWAMIKCGPFLNTELGPDHPVNLSEIFVALLKEYIEPHLFYPRVLRLVNRCLASFESNLHLKPIEEIHKSLGQALSDLGEKARLTRSLLDSTLASYKNARVGEKLPFNAVVAVEALSTALRSVNEPPGSLDTNTCASIPVIIWDILPVIKFSQILHPMVHNFMLADLRACITKAIKPLTAFCRQLPAKASIAYCINFKVNPPTMTFHQPKDVGFPGIQDTLAEAEFDHQQCMVLTVCSDMYNVLSTETGTSP
ncbi:hypothetical protein C8J56DRAFT_885546 [Mycena floridula]|nr:hypothetical protein C8J56DRAFT_885546 [Mycena floridula]